jgi:G:T/U-mismatch repair DNA glycosylase
MPIGEIESHPYLNAQISIPNDALLEKYRFLIVGTFPIYQLTTSDPINVQGNLLKGNWEHYANFQFFYGSMENCFWELFSNAFNQPNPQTPADAIALLDAGGFLITDVVSMTQRVNYSPSDNAISTNKVLNTLQLNYYLNNIKSLQAIFFTSFVAKEWFCQALGLQYRHLIIDALSHQGRRICLFILMSPAGSGRSVNTYIPVFPLNTLEAFNRANKIPYAMQYRMRYYEEFLNLTIPC